MLFAGFNPAASTGKPPSRSKVKGLDRVFRPLALMRDARQGGGGNIAEERLVELAEQAPTDMRIEDFSASEVMAALASLQSPASFRVPDSDMDVLCHMFRELPPAGNTGGYTLALTAADRVQTLLLVTTNVLSRRSSPAVQTYGLHAHQAELAELGATSAQAQAQAQDPVSQSCGIASTRKKRKRTESSSSPLAADTDDAMPQKKKKKRMRKGGTVVKRQVVSRDNVVRFQNSGVPFSSLSPTLSWEIHLLQADIANLVGLLDVMFSGLVTEHGELIAHAAMGYMVGCASEFAKIMQGVVEDIVDIAETLVFCDASSTGYEPHTDGPIDASPLMNMFVRLRERVDSVNVTPHGKTKVGRATLGTRVADVSVRVKRGEAIVRSVDFFNAAVVRAGVVCSSVDPLPSIHRLEMRWRGPTGETANTSSRPANESADAIAAAISRCVAGQAPHSESPFFHFLLHLAPYGEKVDVGSLGKSRAKALGPSSRLTLAQLVIPRVDDATRQPDPFLVDETKALASLPPTVYDLKWARSEVLTLPLSARIPANPFASVEKTLTCILWMVYGLHAGHSPSRVGIHRGQFYASCTPYLRYYELVSSLVNEFYEQLALVSDEKVRAAILGAGTLETTRFAVLEGGFSMRDSAISAACAMLACSVRSAYTNVVKVTNDTLDVVSSQLYGAARDTDPYVDIIGGAEWRGSRTWPSVSPTFALAVETCKAQIYLDEPCSCDAQLTDVVYTPWLKRLQTFMRRIERHTKDVATVFAAIRTMLADAH